MLYTEHWLVAEDGSYPIEAIRLSNTPNSRLSADEPPLEAVWQYGAWSTQAVAKPFVTSVLRAAAQDQRAAAIWLPYEPVLGGFTEDDQWARSLPVLSQAADQYAAPIYLVPHSIAVKRAAVESVSSPLVSGLVTLTPSHTAETESRGAFTRMAQEGAHWRTAGAALGNLAATSALLTGFLGRSITQPAAALHESQKGLSMDVAGSLAALSRKKPAGVLLAAHDKVFPPHVTLRHLRELGFCGLTRTVAATHVSAYINHRHGREFYELWAQTAGIASTGAPGVR